MWLLIVAIAITVDAAVTVAVTVEAAVAVAVVEADPRGALRTAMGNCGVYAYAWMDNKAVYFIDTCYGASKLVNITRNMGHTGESKIFQVIPSIVHYNQFMGGVDV